MEMHDIIAFTTLDAAVNSLGAPDLVGAAVAYYDARLLPDGSVQFPSLHKAATWLAVYRLDTSDERVLVMNVEPFHRFQPDQPVTVKVQF